MSAGHPRLFPVAQEQLTSDDYYTPAWVFERMGIEFDLDVCAPPGGIPWIPAKRYFTQANDGLVQPWEGRIWMNPPYSNVTPWWERFAAHRDGVCLLPTAESRWLDSVWGTADGVVVPEPYGSIKFFKPDRPKKPMEIWFPVILAAFGDECVEAISRLGKVRVLA